MGISLIAIFCIDNRASCQVVEAPFPAQLYLTSCLGEHKWLLKSLFVSCRSGAASSFPWLGECRVEVVPSRLPILQMQQFTCASESNRIFNSGFTVAGIWGENFRNNEAGEWGSVQDTQLMFLFTCAPQKRKAKNNFFPKDSSFRSRPGFLDGKNFCKIS